MSDQHVPVLIQNLPIQIHPPTGEIVTINSEFLISFLEDYDLVQDQDEISINIKTNNDGFQYAYALVKFESLDQAKAAVSEFNCVKLDGNEIYFKLFDEKTKNILFSGTGKLLIKNLSSSIDVIQLYSTFSDYGEVIDCIIPSKNGKSYPYGIVQFREKENAESALLDLEGAKFDNKKIEIVPFEQEKCTTIEEFCKNWQELRVISGLNNFNQLLFYSPSINAEKEKIVLPPKNYPLSCLSLSFSVYYTHSVIVLNNSNAIAIGDNSKHQINNFNLTNFNTWRPISIRQNSKKKFNNFISVVCGDNYTLYLCEPKAPYETHFLAINSPSQDKNSKIFDLEGRIPFTIYGGQYVSASIDTKGHVIIIYENEPIFVNLPEQKKAIQLACMNTSIIALSNDGYLYELSLLKDEKIFKIIDSLSKIKFGHISGTSEHFFAVTKEGQIFTRGNNKFGQLGIGSNVKKVNQFTQLESFTDRKIVFAFAGCNHSLFIDDKGAVFSCGSNLYGELMLSESGDQNSYNKPIPTTVINGAHYAIAGNKLSVAFQFSPPPPNTPNMKITSFKQAKTLNENAPQPAQNNGNINKQNNQVKQTKEINDEVQNKQPKKTKQNKKSAVNDDDDEIIILQNNKRNKKAKQNKKLIDDNEEEEEIFVMPNKQQIKKTKLKPIIKQIENIEDDDGSDDGVINASNKQVNKLKQNASNNKQNKNKKAINDDGVIILQPSKKTIKSKQNANKNKQNNIKKANDNIDVSDEESDDEYINTRIKQVKKEPMNKKQKNFNTIIYYSEDEDEISDNDTEIQSRQNAKKQRQRQINKERNTVRTDEDNDEDDETFYLAKNKQLKKSKQNNKFKQNKKDKIRNNNTDDDSDNIEETENINDKYCMFISEIKSELSQLLDQVTKQDKILNKLIKIDVKDQLDLMNNQIEKLKVKNNNKITRNNNYDDCKDDEDSI